VQFVHTGVRSLRPGPEKGQKWKSENRTFGDFYEISFPKPGFPLAFCAKFLYNEAKHWLGGDSSWVK